MQTLSCLIVDDEPMARKILREYIADIPFLKLVTEVETANKANAVLMNFHVDIMLLDIEMPKLNGLNFLKTITAPPVTILTTAYAAFAIEGYELEVIDYLMKPIAFERFQKAINKAARHLENHGTRRPTDPYFFIKVNLKIEKVYFSEVLYIEGMTNHIVIYAKTRKLVAYLTFKVLEDQLPADKFMRIHKSYIVSVDAIKSIDNQSLDVEGATLPIGKSFKQKLMSRIENIFLRR